MEKYMRMAFWIISFSVTLSDCFPTPTINYLPDFNIDMMRESVTCVEDSVFYTPMSVEDKCFTDALDCIFKELNGTARDECKDPEQRIDQGLETLLKKIHERKGNTNAPTSPTVCACEKWSESSFSKFLDSYESLLQQENAKASTKENKGGK